MLKEFATYVSRQLLPLQRKLGMVNLGSTSKESVEEAKLNTADDTEHEQYSRPDVALDALHAIIK